MIFAHLSAVSFTVCYLSIMDDIRQIAELSGILSVKLGFERSADEGNNVFVNSEEVKPNISVLCGFPVFHSLLIDLPLCLVCLLLLFI